jgi:hypothetical protein
MDHSSAKVQPSSFRSRDSRPSYRETASILGHPADVGAAVIGGVLGSTAVSVPVACGIGFSILGPEQSTVWLLASGVVTDTYVLGSGTNKNRQGAADEC